LYHLYAGATILGDQVDIGSYHQAQTDVCVPQTVGRSRPSFAIDLEIFLVQDRPEKLALPFRKNEVRGLRKAQFFGQVLDDVWFVLAPPLPLLVCIVRACVVGAWRTKSGLQPFKRTHGAG